MRSKNIKWMLLLLVFGIVGLSGCAKGENISVFIDTNEIYMDVESARNLPARVSSGDGEITYHSSDESIAWYSNDLLIAGKVGTCVVYAQAGDAVSDLVTVHVRDFVKEANELRDRIEELYRKGRMSQTVAKYIGLRYDMFPEYAKDIVDNFYIASVFRDYSDDRQVYITQSGRKYHEAGCYRLKGHIRAIPHILALFEGMTACESCKTET